jgi:phage terminase large subunit-like protein
MDDMAERNRRAFEYLYSVERRHARRLRWVTAVLMTPLVVSMLVILYSVAFGWVLPF